MDKNKLIEAAAKLVAKGAWDKAIKEYQKVLDFDPKDVRVLQKMGETYQKKGENPQAARYFVRVAESYTSDGFFLKAVALYKQVLKLDPSLVDINLKLAELHQQLQLLGDAMAFYQLVANHYDKAGDTRKSLDVLKKMIDLDPDNIASRMKLADLYVRDGLNDEAAAQFRKSAEHLKKSNRIDDYLRVAERLSSLEVNNFVLARELAEHYLQRGDQKRALAKLQVCFKADARDVDTLKLLAVAFEGLGQTSKTLSVYKELARAYEEKGNAKAAAEAWAKAEKVDPNDSDIVARRPKPAPAKPVEAPRAVPQPPPPPANRPPFTSSPSRAKPESVGKLLTETDVYLKYGLHDKALEHLRKIFASEPENIDAHEKAYAIYVASNNQAQAFEQLLNVLRLHTRLENAERAQPYLDAVLAANPNHPEVSIFLQTLRPAADDEAVLVDDESDVQEDFIAADESEEVLSAETHMPDDEDEVIEEVIEDEFESHSGVSPDDVMLSEADAVAASQFEVEAPPVSPEALEAPTASYSFDEPLQEVVEDEVELPVDPFSYGTEEAAVELVSEESYQPDLDGSDGPTGMFQAYQEPEAQEPIALEAEAPIEFSSVEEASFEPSGVEEESVDDEALGFSPEPLLETPVSASSQTMFEGDAATPEDDPVAEECDEAAFFLEQGLLEEAREVLETVSLAYPEHARASVLMAQLEALENAGLPVPPEASAVSDVAPMQLAPVTEADLNAPAEENDAFNLAAELADELGDYSQPEVSSSSSGDDYQVSVEEVFAEFKKGLEKVVKPEDVDTHYDLGVAYKEMGLIDDAVSEFAIARKGCLGKRKEVDCLSMMGLLHISKGEFDKSIEVFQLALVTEYAAGDTEKALRYDLAVSYEGRGDLGKALGQFNRISALDASYRDVPQHEARLGQLTVAQSDDVPSSSPSSGNNSGNPPPVPRGRKVGYI